MSLGCIKHHLTGHGECREEDRLSGYCIIDADYSNLLTEYPHPISTRPVSHIQPFISFPDSFLWECSSIPTVEGASGLPGKPRAAVAGKGALTGHFINLFYHQIALDLDVSVGFHIICPASFLSSSSI